ncbi:endomucin isoform X1 [Spea bombifrons]|uniref:endomucin isoform X1 n=1 Tax=Spea bombifrons TaxID=233779 RepID=UPI00234AC3DF|nr:endomucin isoform X1 [Spea bombifrons]
MKPLGAAVLLLAVVNQAWGNGTTTTTLTTSNVTHLTSLQGTTVTVIPTINRSTTSSTSLKEITSRPSRGTTTLTQTFSTTEGGNHPTNFTNLNVTATSFVTQPTGNKTLPTTVNTTVSISTDATRHVSSTLSSGSFSKTQSAVTRPSSTDLATQSTIESERGDSGKTDPSFNPEKELKPEESPTLNRKGLLIGVGCVVAVIIFVVLIFLYKICQKKPQEPENTGAKVATQNKESVKLLSVKTSAADSDLKGTNSPHHTDYIVEF